MAWQPGITSEKAVTNHPSERVLPEVTAREMAIVVADRTGLPLEPLIREVTTTIVDLQIRLADNSM